MKKIKKILEMFILFMLKIKTAFAVSLENLDERAVSPCLYGIPPAEEKRLLMQRIIKTIVIPIILIVGAIILYKKEKKKKIEKSDNEDNKE